MQVFSGMQQDTSMRKTILLDSGSSVNLFCNEGMLQSLQTSNNPVNISTNAGSIDVTHEGHLHNFGMVPFHAEAMTNIFSLGVLSDHYKITMDASVDNAIYVHTPLKVVRFGRNKSNLYTHTPTTLGQDPQPATPEPPEVTTFVQSVEENKLFCTPREVDRAKKARDLLAALGSPSIQDLKTAVTMNAIANLPITTADITLAEKIFGKDLGTLKGKTTKSKPMPIIRDNIETPPEIGDSRSSWELYVDIMFVNKMPYLTTITGALYYRTAIPMLNRKADEIYATLDKVLRLYNAEGYTISDVHADNEFRPLLESLQDELHATLHFSPAGGHVPQAERNNRLIKERIRATYHRLPFQALPIKVMKVLVMESAKKPNFFPNKHGISKYF